jgi:chaperonin GroEL
MSKLVRNVVFGDKLHARIASGFRKVYDVAKESYGPNAGNALIEYPYGDPEISRDGVNNVRKLKFEDAIENATAALATQASKRNDVNVGDGTTGSVILAYHLYMEGRRLVAAGNNQMVVSRQITAEAAKAVKQIDKLKQPLGKNITLKDVATTSAGDEAIGMLVAETVEAVGADGGVTIEDFGGTIIANEIVDGFYFRKGIIHQYLFANPGALESKHSNVPILVLDKQLSSQTDAAEIMDKVVGKFKELVIIGNVSGDALSFLVQLRIDNKILLSIVEPEYEARNFFLDDLALLTGAAVITEGLDPTEFSLDMLGFAAKVVVTSLSTTILGSDGETKAVNVVVKELQSQLADSQSETDIKMIRKRLSWLTGKVAIIRVGGSSEVEQREVKLRVIDA